MTRTTKADALAALRTVEVRSCDLGVNKQIATLRAYLEQEEPAEPREPEGNFAALSLSASTLFDTVVERDAEIRRLRETVTSLENHLDRLSSRSRSTPPSSPTAEPSFAWLLERSQPEGQQPNMYWLGDHCFTEESHNALRFPTKEAAEAACPSCIELRRHHAVEHGFMDRAAPVAVADWRASEAVKVCGTCGGQGTGSAPFDTNCPAEWAHGWVRA